MRILVLGGTAWLGRAVATEAVGRGHEVVCAARGSAPPAEGARSVQVDRDQPGALAGLAAERWDAVVDVARQPGHVQRSTAALRGAGRYLFVSTGNVYADTATPHLDEDAALLDPTGTAADPGQQYGMNKVACEQAVLDAFGDRALIARAGLIGGPGDPSGRSTYWPWRFAHPSGDGVLVPDAFGRSSELIDARDLAAWLVDCAERGTSGVFNAVGPEVPLGEHLGDARVVAGFHGSAVAAPEAWLAEQGVQEWMGPRSLPLWLADPDWQGFTARDGSRARRAGLRARPLRDTLRDALAWEEQQPAHPHGAGLTDDEERALLALLG